MHWPPVARYTPTVGQGLVLSVASWTTISQSTTSSRAPVLLWRSYNCRATVSQSEVCHGLPEWRRRASLAVFFSNNSQLPKAICYFVLTRSGRHLCNITGRCQPGTMQLMAISRYISGPPQPSIGFCWCFVVKRECHVSPDDFSAM